MKYLSSKKSRRRLHRIPGREQGQVLVEFALVLGLLLFILMGMITVGYWMSVQQVVTLAAKDGAREGALTLNNTRIESVVRQSMKGFDSSGEKTTVSIDPANPYDSNRVRGKNITVRVTYELPFKLLPVDVFRTVTASASARIECQPKFETICTAGLY